MVKQHPTDNLILALVVISVIIMTVFESYSQPSGMFIVLYFDNKKSIMYYVHTILRVSQTIRIIRLIHIHLVRHTQKYIHIELLKEKKRPIVSKMKCMHFCTGETFMKLFRIIIYKIKLEVISSEWLDYVDQQ